MLAQVLYLLFVGKSSLFPCHDAASIANIETNNIVGIMQRGFVRYVQGGEKKEKNFAELAWIMGGVVESPLVLFRYFFKIAFYSVGLHFQESGVLGGPCQIGTAARISGSNDLNANYERTDVVKRQESVSAETARWLTQ